MNINTPLQGAAIALPFTKAADPTKRNDVDVALRVPFTKRLPDNVRNHFVAMCGEYVGTTLFLFLALGGTQVANNIPSSSGLTVAEVGSNPQQLQYIALCFGFSLAVNAWVFFRISGGLFNPAVTFGMCLIGALPWFRGVLLLIVQIMGGMTAAGLVACMFPGELTVQTTLGGGTTVVQGLFIEMMLTAELVFTIFMLAAEKHKSTFIAPVGIGLALFVAELVGVYFTGGSLNPARSFGPAVANHNFHSYHWIYWLGPFLGSAVAAGFYKFIKILEYETANPEQDAAERHVMEKQASPSSSHRPFNTHFKHNKHAGANGTTTNTAGGLIEPTDSNQYLEPAAPRPGTAARKPSHSPAMASVNEPFRDIHDGHQSEVAPQAVDSPGMAVSGDTMRERLNRGPSYMA